MEFLTHPFYWIVILFLISWFTKRERLKKWTFRTGIGFLVFFTNTVLFCEFARLWEPDGKKMEELEHYDVAIVLGGMAEYDSSLDRLSMRRGSDRIWQAIHLYHLGKVDKLLLSGANGDLIDKGLQEAVQFKEVLIDNGIPACDILVDSVSKNTYENAVESKKIIDQFPELQRILLITSALHMNRAEACFIKAGFENMTTFTTDHYTGRERGYRFDQWLIPNESVLSDWSKLIHEWLGYLTYSIMGYL
ncbi:MAG: YdcF family protein [Bacteroidetes bacterium]|nr:YdcF family protein [Bacteroidota bacterium]